MIWIKTLTGLGFSGGGIRSSTFNLGILQAFQRYRRAENRWIIFPRFPAGGYIGACYTWFCSKLGYGRDEAEDSGRGGGGPGREGAWEKPFDPKNTIPVRVPD